MVAGWLQQLPPQKFALLCGKWRSGVNYGNLFENFLKQERKNLWGKREKAYRNNNRNNLPYLPPECPREPVLCIQERTQHASGARRGVTDQVGSGVSTGIRDFLILAVALFAMAASACYYVLAVLDQDRALSRAAVVAFLIFGVMAIVFFARIL